MDGKLAGVAALAAAFALTRLPQWLPVALMARPETGVSLAQIGAERQAWFLGFALAQPPVGWALDRIGQRGVTAALLPVAALGAVLFAAAPADWAPMAAMFLIGVGSAPALLAVLHLCARTFTPREFAMAAGTLMALGVMANAVAPPSLAALAERTDWRAAPLALAAAILATAVLVAAVVRNPPQAAPSPTPSSAPLWPVLPLVAVGSAVSSGLGGFWIGPYLGQTFGAGAADLAGAGMALLAGAAAGPLVYGMALREAAGGGARRFVVLAGGLPAIGACVALALAPAASLVVSTALLAVIVASASSLPAMYAHVRDAPPERIGRGLAWIGLFAVLGAALGPRLAFDAWNVVQGLPPFQDFGDPFAGLLLLQAAALGVALAIYAASGRPVRAAPPAAARVQRPEDAPPVRRGRRLN